MKTKTLQHLTLVAGTLVLAAVTPAQAQQTEARWKPHVESIIVRAGPITDWMNALTASHLGKAFAVSASIPVPYSDLDVTKEQDVSELDRRIHVAAGLVCGELDAKYPPTLYPLIEGYSGQECARRAASDSMEQVAMIVANAKH